MTDSVWIIGTSMTPFGRHDDADLLDLTTTAVRGALNDASVTMRDIQLVAAGTMFEATSHLAQRLQKQMGQTGVPAYNVINACATGATALRVAMLSILAGESDIALAVGAEKMGKMGMLGGGRRKAGAPVEAYQPSGRYGAIMAGEGILGTSLMPGVFAQAGMQFARSHPDITVEHFAAVASKNHYHSTLNPLSQYQKEFSVEQVMAAEMIAFPNTVLMCSPTADGAAAAVVVSDRKLKTMDVAVRRRAVKISASVMTSDPWTESGQALPDVNTLTQSAARQAYEASGLGPDDLDLVELHDCFATAELMHYENLGLCEPGGAVDFLASGAPFRDGRLPVNVSGGLLSKGHPIAATGLANIYEVATHLRHEAGQRQIEGARVGMTHVLGLASACVVHVLERSAQ